jgi:hypothetical protein
VSHDFWIFWAVSIPLTLAVLLGWAFFRNKNSIPKHVRRTSEPIADASPPRKVSRRLIRLGNALGINVHDRLDNYEMKDGLPLGFPEIPGEQQRNVQFQHIREQYDHGRASNSHEDDRAPRASLTSELTDPSAVNTSQC